MRKLIVVVAVLLLALPVLAAPPATDHQKTLYAMGVLLARQLAVFELSAEEYEFVKEGIADIAAGKKPVAEPEAFGTNINALAQERMKIAAQKQKELSKPYLEKAAAEQGAQKTASGLIYQEMRPGTGASPKVSDTVKVHYVGTLIDGKEFDSSVRRGEPVEFPLGQVIPCWVEGVGMMKVGGKAKLVCPAELAYGDQGSPPVIPGGATLAFEVELLEIKAPPAPAPQVAPAPKKPASTKKSPKK
ncbi:MAG: FKBP-type peptidyl-prolyl cis-trans isomerase [Smithellaceae bacterium]|nr:FKBP-type peptidyl-prolyl cis-trans isomerase [Smithellaceae bacterium]NLX52630.1 FKBP-type peptidyl-prolyl cis-trans isomerase [Deltaproteobacteria bacterium]